MNLAHHGINKQHGVNLVIWSYWSGSGMNSKRQLCYTTMKEHIGVPVILVTPENIKHYVLSGHPLHKAFPYLSVVHQSDYLRAYLMHFWGGGWHDIKATKVSFLNAWAEFENQNVYLVGRQESSKGVVKIHDEKGNWMPDHWQEIVGTSAWVGRAQTPFTNELLIKMEALLDQNFEQLKKYPAKHPRERKLPSTNRTQELINRIKNLASGRTHNYPLPWTVFGNVFQPLVLKYKNHIKQTLPRDQIKWAGIKHR